MDYDVVVIGAGIQGAAVAQAAAASGYKVLVLEQYSSPAQGTSSRSSKLIHGGLRYLESAQFSLVRECLQERKWLLKNAPHLVELKPFYIPVYKSTSRTSWKIAIGLAIYSLFSRKKFHRIKRSEWGKLDGLKTQYLKAVYCYYDAQTDDTKLTEAVLASAQSLGAKVYFNTKFEQASILNKHCRIEIKKSGSRQQIETRVLVNATGPWVAETTTRISPMAKKQPAVDLVQGAHIEVPGSPRKGLYYIEAADHRAVFVMPWRDHLLIGTTENNYSGDPAEVVPLEEEINYLLVVYNQYFEKTLARSDVINTFAGLRVLPKGSGSAFSRPRDTLIIGNQSESPRVLNLYGGKLTAHRATAEDVMKMLRSVLPPRKKSVDTRTLRLPEV